MSIAFDPAGRAVIVPVTVVGPRRNYELRCALDTGSMQTVLPATLLRALGYDLSRPNRRTRIRSATGAVPAPVIRVSAVAALDHVRTEFPVAAHDLPLGVESHGLLGLDFFRGWVLRLDFSRGRIRLWRPRWWQFWR